MSGCPHYIDRSSYRYVYDDYDGEEVYQWVEDHRSTQVDISIGAFRCTQCGEVGYYTGSWRRYFEEGVDCAGTHALQPGETERVRRAAANPITTDSGAGGGHG